MQAVSPQTVGKLCGNDLHHTLAVFFTEIARISIKVWCPIVPPTGDTQQRKRIHTSGGSQATLLQLPGYHLIQISVLLCQRHVEKRWRHFHQERMGSHPHIRRQHFFQRCMTNHKTRHFLPPPSPFLPKQGFPREIHHVLQALAPTGNNDHPAFIQQSMDVRYRNQHSKCRKSSPIHS